MAKTTAKKKAGKKAKAAKRVSMKEARKEVNAVMKKLKGARSPKAADLRAAIKQFNNDTKCGQTLFIEI